MELSNLPEPLLPAEVVISLLSEKTIISSHKDSVQPTSLTVTLQSKAYPSKHPPKHFTDSIAITRVKFKHT